MSMLSEKPTIHRDCMIVDTTFGEWTEIGRNSFFQESEIGDYTYFDGYNQVSYTYVGKFCSIASFVRLNPGNHPIHRVTQHHMTYRRRMFCLSDTDDEEFFNWRRENKVTIGHDVWLGHNVCVMPGVTIGNGAVVGSSSVVTKDIEPYTINVGVPARPIKRRFSEKIADALEHIKWWDWSHEEIKECLTEFNDIEAFIEKYLK